MCPAICAQRHSMQLDALTVVVLRVRVAVCFCRRATELKLSEYLVVGPSIVTDKAGMSDSMIAELFESVRLTHVRRI